MSKLNIAVIAGDGVGTQVMPEGIRVLEATAALHGLQLNWHHFDWSCEYYARTGAMKPEDGIDQLREFDHYVNRRRCVMHSMPYRDERFAEMGNRHWQGHGAGATGALAGAHRLRSGEPSRCGFSDVTDIGVGLHGAGSKAVNCFAISP